MSIPTAPLSRTGRSALEVARFCAHEGAEIALRSFRRHQQVTVKGRGNLVTQADLKIEARIHEILAREFPEHAILSEETRATVTLEGWVWVVDPLDGTRNYVSGIPFFCVNMALCRDGEPVLALTFDPNHDEVFWAEAGGGAWVNDEPAHVSAKASVQASVLGVDLGYDDRRGKDILRLVHELFPGMQSVRVPGSAALGLAYAAVGRYDLFVHNHLFPWDLAAGILLVREAGGMITDRGGRAVSLHSEAVVAGGRQAHADFLRIQLKRGWGEPALE